MAAQPALRPGVAEAMDAVFALSEAIHTHQLSALDLAAGCELAIEDGHDMLVIQLCMMLHAVQLSQKGSSHG